MWKELFHFFMTQLLSKTKGNASTIFRYTQIEENIVNLGTLYIELVFLRRLEKIFDESSAIWKNLGSRSELIKAYKCFKCFPDNISTGDQRT